MTGSMQAADDRVVETISDLLRRPLDLDALVAAVAQIMPLSVAIADGTSFAALQGRLSGGDDALATAWRQAVANPADARRLRTRALGLVPLVGIAPGRTVGVDVPGGLEPLAAALAWLTGGTLMPPGAASLMLGGAAEVDPAEHVAAVRLRFGTGWIADADRPILAARQAPCWFVEELPATGIDLYARTVTAATGAARFVALRPLCVVDEAGRRLDAGIGEIAIDRGDRAAPVRTGRRGVAGGSEAIAPMPVFAGDLRIDGAALDTVALARAIAADVGGDVHVLAKPALAGGTEALAFVQRAGDAPGGGLPTSCAVHEVPVLPRTAGGRIDVDALAALPIVGPADLAAGGITGRSAGGTAWRFGPARRAGRVASAPPPPREASLPRPSPWADTVSEPAERAIAAESLVRGPPPLPPEALPRDLPAMLNRLADRARADDLTIVEDGGAHAMSYAELAARARGAAGALQAAGVAPGQRVILHLDPIGDVLTWFWGCHYAGACVTPVAVSADPDDDAPRIAALAEQLGAALIVTAAAPGTFGPTMLAPEVVADGHLPVDIDPDAPALILATSGSTGAPKLVPQSHRALIAQGHGSGEAAGLSADDVSLNWMPLDHVGGIVMFHLRDVQAGARQIQVARTVVLVDPRRWLDLLDHHRVTVSWAPNFAFGLVADAIAAAPPTAGRWSLERMRYLVNGGEAVVPAAARRFLELTAPYGLSADVMRPAWGMSETCSLVLVAGEGARDRFRGDDPVSVGWPIRGIDLRIVDAGGRTVPRGREGRLEVRGVSVTRGYLGAADEGISADGWFDTGDRARVTEDGVRITGRDKDLVIVNGRNIACAELEQAVATVVGADHAHTTAVAFRPAQAGTEQPALFFVTTPGADAAAVGRELVATLARTMMVSATAIPVAADAVPRTRIGKPQRQQLRARLEAGEFAAEAIVDGEPASMLPGWFFRPAWRADRLRPGLSRRRRWAVLATGQPSAALIEALAADGDAASAHDLGAVEATREADTVVVLASGDDEGVDAALGRAVRAAPTVRQWLLVEHGPATTTQDAAARGAALGLLLSLRRERAGTRVRRIVVPAVTDAVALAQIVREEADALGDDGSIRRGGDVRERLLLTPEAFLADRPSAVVAGGRYLVTGALGAIGGMVVRWLHDIWGCEVIGVGRSPAGADVPRLARFRYAMADVGDAEALAAVLGPEDAIDGVFHLAGAFELADLAAMDDARHRRLTHAKVEGARACARLLGTAGRGRPLLVLFGSVSSWFGGAGASAYAAACAAQEALTEQLNRDGTVAAYYLGWSQWPGVGLTRRNPVADLAARHGFLGVDERLGLASLHRVLAGAPGRVFIGLDQDNPSILRETDQGLVASLLTVDTEARTARPDERRHDRFGTPFELRQVPATAAGDWQGYVEAEATLVAIWRGILGVTSIDVDRNFFELGGNSLRLLQAKGQVEAAFGVTLALADLLRLPTVRQLAAHLADQRERATVDARTPAAAALGRDRAAARLSRRGRAAPRP